MWDEIPFFWTDQEFDSRTCSTCCTIVRMTSVPDKLYVIVERSFGERLATLPEGIPVWIVDTPKNKPVAQRLWKARQHHDHFTGITTFNDNSSSSPETILISNLDTIELHHPRYTQLEVLGTPLTDEIRTELGQYGFNEFQPTPEGFRCLRSHTPRVLAKSR
jgi:hypothetical protein